MRTLLKARYLVFFALLLAIPAASHALAEALPDARYVEIRRADHAPFLSHTAEFAALVTSFLRGEADAVAPEFNARTAQTA